MEEILTAQEVADYIRRPLATVRKLAREGNIPAMKAGRDWRFTRSQIDAYIRGEWVPVPRAKEAQ